MPYTLAVVDPAYSSWSLRGWLLFAHFDLPVTMEIAHLRTPELEKTLAPYAPARTVPAMRISGRESIVIWESLAIAEALAERYPDIVFWPTAPVARGLARSITAEMHGGFSALRSACPMNIRRSYTGFQPSDAVMADLARIEVLWASTRADRQEGPWLFGDYTIADAFFAPVAMRIATYDLPVGPAAAAYVAAHLSDPIFLKWRAMALADPVVLPEYEFDLPERPWPGPETAPATAPDTASYSGT